VQTIPNYASIPSPMFAVPPTCAVTCVKIRLDETMNVPCNMVRSTRRLVITNNRAAEFVPQMQLMRVMNLVFLASAAVSRNARLEVVCWEV